MPLGQKTGSRFFIQGVENPHIRALSGGCYMPFYVVQQVNYALDKQREHGQWQWLVATYCKVGCQGRRGLALDLQCRAPAKPCIHRSHVLSKARHREHLKRLCDCQLEECTASLCYKKSACGCIAPQKMRTLTDSISSRCRKSTSVPRQWQHGCSRE